METAWGQTGVGRMGAAGFPARGRFASPPNGLRSHVDACSGSVANSTKARGGSAGSGRGSGFDAGQMVL